MSNIDTYIFDGYNYINFLKNCRLRRGIACKDISTDEDESIDPSEPLYCLCNQIAYGTMVACDNKKVGIIIKKNSTKIKINILPLVIFNDVSHLK